MMYSNDMDANPYQQKIQGSQLVSNAGQRQMTNETQGRVAMEGMQRVQGLSAAQQAQQDLGTNISLAVFADKGKDSELARMADPDYMSTKKMSVAQQSRLKGLA